MKTPDLIQSRLFHKVELTLESDGITVNESDLSRSSKTQIDYESIPPKASELTISSKRLLIAAIIMTVVATICLPLAFDSKADWSAPAVWGIVAVFLWCGFFFSKKSLIRFVQNGSGLNLYKNNPSEKSVGEFVDKMFQFRNAYLLKKYGRFLDEERWEEKMARLKYLEAQGVLSEAEFETKREEITNGNKSINSFGFTPIQNLQ